MIKDKTAFKVGIVTIIMAILIAILMIWKSGILIRAAGYELIGEFENINGLLKGAAVRYRGYKVGKVTDFSAGPKAIRVHFYVKLGVKIPSGSTLRIVFDGLIGEKYIDIHPNSASKKLVKRGDILRGHATSSLADFVDIGTKNLEDTKAILGTMRDVITDEDVFGAMKNMIIQAEDLTSNLAGIVKEIRHFSEEKSLNVMLTSLENVAESLNLITNEIKENIVTEEAGSKINTIISNLAEFTERLKNLLGEEEQDLEVPRSDQKRKGSPLKLLKNLGLLRIKPDIAFQYWMGDRIASYYANLQFQVEDYFVLAGLGDKLGTSQLLTLQYGNYFSDGLGIRLGLFYTMPGFGIDYSFLPQLDFSFNAFNLNNLEFELLGRYHLLPKRLAFLFGVGKRADESSLYDNYSLGLSFFP